MDRLDLINSICLGSMDCDIDTTRIDNSDNKFSIDDSDEEYESDTGSDTDTKTNSSKTDNVGSTSSSKSSDSDTKTKSSTSISDSFGSTSSSQSMIDLNDSVENETDSSDSESEDEIDSHQGCVVEKDSTKNVSGLDSESSDDSDTDEELHMINPESSVSKIKNGNGTTRNNKVEPCEPISSCTDSDSEDSDDSSNSSEEEKQIKERSQQTLKNENSSTSNSTHSSLTSNTVEDSESEKEINEECDLLVKSDRGKLQTEIKSDGVKSKVKKMKSAKRRSNRPVEISNVKTTKTTKQNAFVVPPPPLPPPRPPTPVNVVEKKITASNSTGDNKITNAKPVQVDSMAECFNLIKNGVKLRSTKANIKDQTKDNVESAPENQKLNERPKLLSVEGYDSNISNQAEGPPTKSSKTVRNVNTNVIAHQVVANKQNNGSKDVKFDVNNKSIDELDELEIQLMLQLLKRQKEKSIKVSDSAPGKNNSAGISLEQPHSVSKVIQQNTNGTHFHSKSPALRQTQDDRVRDIVKDELVNGSYRLQPTNPPDTPDINITALMKNALETIFKANNTTDDEDNGGSYQSEDEMQSWEDGEQNSTAIQRLK